MCLVLFGSTLTALTCDGTGNQDCCRPPGPLPWGSKPRSRDQTGTKTPPLRRLCGIPGRGTSQFAGCRPSSAGVRSDTARTLSGVGAARAATSDEIGAVLLAVVLIGDLGRGWFDVREGSVVPAPFRASTAPGSALGRQETARTENGPAGHSDHGRRPNRNPTVVQRPGHHAVRRKTSARADKRVFVLAHVLVCLLPSARAEVFRRMRLGLRRRHGDAVGLRRRRSGRSRYSVTGHWANAISESSTLTAGTGSRDRRRSLRRAILDRP